MENENKIAIERESRVFVTKLTQAMNKQMVNEVHVNPTYFAPIYRHIMSEDIPQEDFDYEDMHYVLDDKIKKYYFIRVERKMEDLEEGLEKILEVSAN